MTAPDEGWTSGNLADRMETVTPDIHANTDLLDQLLREMEKWNPKVEIAWMPRKDVVNLVEVARAAREVTKQHTICNCGFDVLATALARLEQP